MKKRIAAGITAFAPERKFKVNTMRWRKKPKRFNLAGRNTAKKSSPPLEGRRQYKGRHGE
jgi:hypothetical protein